MHSSEVFEVVNAAKYFATLQGPSTKLILWFLHNTVHLGSIYQNIKVGIETYVIQALNEPLFDEIDRSRDEL